MQVLALNYHDPAACTVFAPTRMCQSSDFRYINTSLSYFFNVFFALECFLKVLGMGFTAYIRVFLNRLDFVLVMISAVDIVGEMVTEGQEGTGLYLLFRILRLFRVLRVARILSRNTHLQRVVKTVLGSGREMLNLGVFVLFMITMFGIIGMHLCVQ